MDYREQANLMQRDAEEFDGPGYIIGDLRQGAKSITDLLARAEAAEARAEKAERERDAAVRDVFEVASAKCFWCKHQDHKWLSDGKMDDLCFTCLKNNKCNWKWRGQKEE